MGKITPTSTSTLFFLQIYSVSILFIQFSSVFDQGQKNYYHVLATVFTWNFLIKGGDPELTAMKAIMYNRIRVEGKKFYVE